MKNERTPAKLTKVVPILNFYELTEQEQKDYIDTYGDEETASEQMYIHCPHGNLYPLEMFTRLQNSFWDGATHLTNTCGLTIKIGRTGERALIGLHY